MKTYQTTIDGQRRRVTVPDSDAAADSAAPDDPSAERLAESLADALQSIADMPPVAPGADITLGDAINAYHGAVRIARDAVRFYYDRRREPVHGNDVAVPGDIAGELSPQAVAVIATRSNRSRQSTVCRDTGVECQVQWFADRLIERLGGKKACARLLAELDA